eukprot:CAMPEP_0196664820 /NCGR_PEP_ID=MMETSP1086-20130531/58523_1 /TAXON_ID=77921 /ORGANISM="Cyanoptyche  gloeocystis , Strain SAG4.97" /LENGTH=266 /DNA_ID=CAMNT_0042001289 /DNA_START=157 /DNA_END=957 /DNA_ORIENTATION=-
MGAGTSKVDVPSNAAGPTSSTSFRSNSYSSRKSLAIDAGQQEVPTVITWAHGGNRVYVIGTFCGWKERIPMHRSGNEFNTIQNLKPGQYEYKFVVDNEWKFAPEQATTFDNSGNVNNIIDVVPYTSTLMTDDLKFKSSHGKPRVPYSQEAPTDDEYNREPPSLPPHLFHTLLNTQGAPGGDALVLARPQHVTLNHMYCATHRSHHDHLLVVGITHRYKSKFVTTVLYKCLPDGAPPQSPITPSVMGASERASMFGPPSSIAHPMFN